MDTLDRTLAALCVALLSLGACGQTAVEEGSKGEDEWSALMTEVGPDWEVITDYTKRHRQWSLSMMNRLGSGEEADSDDPESGPPDVSRAVAAAMAILDQRGEHEKTVGAAQFLTNQAAATPGGDEHAYRGAKALLEHVPDFQGWPFVLGRLDAMRRPGRDGKSTRPAIDRFFGEMASDAEDPLLRAAGQFYVAVGLMRSVNGFSLSPEERAARRESALDAATGLSAGVEDEGFLGSAFAARRYEEIEADLIRSIRHATVGSTLPDVTGARLDGVEETLSSYRGRVVLLDFWATWCKPCIAVLPKLRRMVADLPAEEFVLLSISVDGNVDLVTEFMEDEPMPWAHWHVGVESEVTRVLDVSAFPTYILVGREGEILARGGSLSYEFMELLEETVGAGND